MSWPTNISYRLGETKSVCSILGYNYDADMEDDVEVAYYSLQLYYWS